MEKLVWGLAIFILAHSQIINGQYVASVVEHVFINHSTPNITIEENIKLYVYQIEAAKNQNSQIIVFPEYGLTGLVEDPTNYAIEIPNASDNTTYSEYYLNRLADAAIEHQIYVVVNLLEKATNEKNETIYYNTNVVFNKLGAIVAKYRKINLFEEPWLTPGNETVTFTTDFGITFGIFTCADILYYHPSKTILANSTVSDIIFPTAWSSLLPFHMSLSVQSGYSTANKVNLLAANINNPSQGMGGSGIYSKDGTILRRYLSGTSSTVLLTATIELTTPVKDVSLFGFDILRNETVDNLANYITKTYPFDKYVYKPLTFGAENLTEEICDGSLCCTFTFDVYLNETNSTEVYKLMAFDGNFQSGDFNAHVKICSLLQCTADDISTCGLRPSTSLTTRFRNITVTGKFKGDSFDFYQPVTLRGDLLPVSNITYNEFRENDVISISLSVNKTETNVLAFGIYGRSSATNLSIGLSFVVFLFLCQKLL